MLKPTTWLVQPPRSLVGGFDNVYRESIDAAFPFTKSIVVDLSL